MVNRVRLTSGRFLAALPPSVRKGSAFSGADLLFTGDAETYRTQGNEETRYQIFISEGLNTENNSYEIKQELGNR